MDIIILVLQIGLSAIFLYFGMSKILMTPEQIAKKVSWAFDYSEKTLKVFGVIEVLGALGLILPYQLDILPILTPMSATGLAMMMGGSIGVHLRRDEIYMILINIFIIFLLAGVGFQTLLTVFGVDL